MTQNQTLVNRVEVNCLNDSATATPDLLQVLLNLTLFSVQFPSSTCMKAVVVVVMFE